MTERLDEKDNVRQDKQEPSCCYTTGSETRTGFRCDCFGNAVECVFACKESFGVLWCEVVSFYPPLNNNSFKTNKSTGV